MSQTKVKSGLVEDNSIDASKLDVTGDGTEGQALLSDGDGTFSWGQAGETYTAGTGVTLTGTEFSIGQSVATTDDVEFNNITATSLTETSAQRFKENIEEDIDASIVNKLRPVSYHWKEDKKKDYGFIAEEVNELDPTLTTQNEDGEMLGVKYTKLIPFLVKKIQEQEERIKQLENGKS